MKYRIKITTYKTGRKEYIAQVKKGFFWFGIYYDGGWSIDEQIDTMREDALRRIDKHFDGNAKKQTIEFEYIDK